jgi:hypothetical protein
MKIAFKVEFERPPRATIQEMKEYIEDAVSSWRGSLYPGYLGDFIGNDDPDPMWELNGDTVKVRRIHDKSKEAKATDLI